MEYILDYEDMKPGWKYFVSATAGYYTWLLADQCIWEVTAVERPKKLPLWGNLYDVSVRTLVENGNGYVIGRRDRGEFKLNKRN
jgi:hypothetical protein